MRKFILSFSLFLIVSFVNAQKASDESAVKQAVLDLFEGISNVDMNAIKTNVTNDFIILEQGVVWNMDSVQHIMNQFKGLSYHRINKLDFFKTEVKGSSAWVAYNNAAEITINGRKASIEWLESAFLVKENNKWKVKMLHSTVKERKVSE